MPSPSRPLTRLELVAASVILGIAALGALTLIWHPRPLPNLLGLQQLFLPWVQAGNVDQDSASDSLAMPLVGQWSRQKSSGPITVPPPVVPQVYPSDWLDSHDLALQPQTSPFTDLPTSHWVYPMVSELASRKVISGFLDGSFRPEQPMTRAEFASQLARAFNLSLVYNPQQFIDISSESWAAKDIQSAIQMGFLTGYPDGMFFPNQPISRIQVLTALAKGLNLNSSSSSKVVLRYFQDYDQVPSWAINPLVAATEAGLVVNYPDVDWLTPNRPANRAEVTAIIYRALVYIGHLEDISSPHWVQPKPMLQ